MKSLRFNEWGRATLSLQIKFLNTPSGIDFRWASVGGQFEVDQLVSLNHDLVQWTFKDLMSVPGSTQNSCLVRSYKSICIIYHII